MNSPHDFGLDRDRFEWRHASSPWIAQLMGTSYADWDLMSDKVLASRPEKLFSDFLPSSISSWMPLVVCSHFVDVVQRFSYRGISYFARISSRQISHPWWSSPSSKASSFLKLSWNWTSWMENCWETTHLVGISGKLYILLNSWISLLTQCLIHCSRWKFNDEKTSFSAKLPWG